MKLPAETKEKAISLRKKGYSLKEISETLGIAKSTSSLWLRDIPLSKRAKARLKKRGILGQYKAMVTKNKKRRQRKERYKTWAKNILTNTPKSKGLLQICCSLLYWAEGGKYTDDHLEFTNSDPEMISTFLKLLRKGFNIDETKLRANIHLHQYHNDSRQKAFWSNITEIPITKFNKSYLKPNTQKRIRKNYPGCVRICYYSADVSRRIQALYTNFSEYV